MKRPSWAVVKTNYGCAHELSIEKQPFPRPLIAVETVNLPVLSRW